MIVYIAQPIDLCSPSSPHFSACEDLRVLMHRKGVVVYSPARAWSHTDQANEPELDALSEINFYTLDRADLIVAMAPPGVPSVGVPIEVYHTLTLNPGKVALWFGESPRIGAMWTHLIGAFPTRVYVLPAAFDRQDVQDMLGWASSGSGDSQTEVA